jgi:hypothetical protein
MNEGVDNTQVPCGDAWPIARRRLLHFISARSSSSSISVGYAHPFACQTMHTHTKTHHSLTQSIKSNPLTDTPSRPPTGARVGLSAEMEEPQKIIRRPGGEEEEGDADPSSSSSSSSPQQAPTDHDDKSGSIDSSDSSDSGGGVQQQQQQQHAGEWSFQLVRGSIYVVGEGIEALARDGRAALEAAPGLTPGVKRMVGWLVGWLVGWWGGGGGGRGGAGGIARARFGFGDGIGGSCCWGWRGSKKRWSSCFSKWGACLVHPSTTRSKSTFSHPPCTHIRKIDHHTHTHTQNQSTHTHTHTHTQNQYTHTHIPPPHTHTQAWCGARQATGSCATGSTSTSPSSTVRAL